MGECCITGEKGSADEWGPRGMHVFLSWPPGTTGLADFKATGRQKVWERVYTGGVREGSG